MVSSSSVLLSCLQTLIVLKGLQATYYPDGYKGCFLDKEDRILEIQFPNTASNGGIYCKGICREFRYRYAGTENGEECFCGDNVKDYEKKPDSECNTKCTGNANEYCGGKWRISVYDNFGTTTKRNLTESTTTPATFTSQRRQSNSTTTFKSTSGAGTTNFKGIDHHAFAILIPIAVSTAFQYC